MKKTVCMFVLLLTSALHLMLYAQNSSKSNQEMKTEANKKVLVAFFSHTGENYAVGNIEKGNTHIIAEMIAGETGGTLFEIVPSNAYPKTYNACVEVAKKEKEANARPAIQGDVPVEEYDVIFVGYPNWWGTMPMCVYTFLELYNFKGKKILPFCTHEGSGLGHSEDDIRQLCPNAVVKDGLAIRGSLVASSGRLIKEWLKRNNI